MATIPTGVTVFAYQVGFGDCLLVRFEYPGSKNLHLLIDFGTTKLPPTADKKRMQEIADDIKQKCGTAGLLAVVATHRHQDHISGFATNAQGTASGNVIASLKPKLVLQPWTEHPKVAVDATGPAFAGPNGGGKGFAQALVGMQKFANRVTRFAASEAGKRLSPLVREQLSFIGQNNLSNLSAVQNLMNMGQGAKGEYLYFGARTKLATLLPGVKVHVLGPPTIKQHDNVRNQNPKNKDEYWHLQARAHSNENKGPRTKPLFPNADMEPGGKLPAYARWLSFRVREANEEQLLGLVRSLDDELNNTSLVLLFEIGTKKLLFPGDAQWENWEYALSQDSVRKLLADVNLYKVGHHGSLNATPKTMWSLFANKGTASKAGRLKSVLSTLPGKHGSEKNNSEVPRKTLLKALQDESHLDNTDELPSGTLCTETRLAI